MTFSWNFGLGGGLQSLSTVSFLNETVTHCKPIYTRGHKTQSWADRWCEWNGSRPRLTPVGWQRNVTILRSSPSCSQSLSMMRMIWSVSMSWRRSSPAYNITVYPQGDPIKGDLFIWLPSSLNAQTNLYNLWHTPGVLGSQYICQLESRFSFSTSAVA